jgi:hypothetical protein
MTNFDPTKLDWAAGLLAGWTYDKPVNKWFQGQFRHAHRLTRPCPTCTETIVLDVTTKALEGKATNHGLALRRCKKCRLALKAGPEAYAVRKAEVAPAVAASVVQPAAAVQKNYGNQSPVEIAVGMSELESLRSANATMKEELEGLYAQLKELRGTQAVIEQPAMPVVPKPVQTYKLPPEPLTMAESTRRINAALAQPGEELLQKWLTQNKAQKMPWEC